MSFLGVRIDEDLYTHVKSRAKLTGRTVSDYVKELIRNDLSDTTHEIDDSWLINASYIFEITVGQINYAIRQNHTAASALMQISGKSKKYDLLVDDSDQNDLIVTIQSHDEFIVVKTQKAQNKQDAVISILKQIDDELTNIK